MKDALKYLEKNIPDLQKMAVAYMPLGTQEELREQIIEVALDRAFLLDPLPADEAGFQAPARRRTRPPDADRQRGRAAGRHDPAEYAARAAQDQGHARASPRRRADATQQLQRLVPKRFLAATPWAQLQHFPRYLKAIVLRLDKLRADPARDARALAELQAAGAALLAPGGRAQGRGGRRACRNSAGCWRNCA